jgi:hypothetical protein
MRVPATHVVHGVQLGAFAVALYVLPVQAAHVRLAVAVPAIATRVPMAQSSHGLQLAAFVVVL